ncbi:hypothetical protein NHX12_011238 [Muraenolepis orangiensis]|uniref:Uncharacterized protein n=1 Tax=Muraenolepis orangiensis TaxID=630683 RepID=A0A9Q0DHB1_9TELE|nr:hypothetical protein NHX12_011238 [Muraenolepis orangiensis]
MDRGGNNTAVRPCERRGVTVLIKSPRKPQCHQQQTGLRSDQRVALNQPPTAPTDRPTHGKQTTGKSNHCGTRGADWTQP